MLQGERSWGSKLAPTALLSVPGVPTVDSAPCPWARNAGIRKAPTTTNVMNARRARVLGQCLMCVSVILPLSSMARSRQMSSDRPLILARPWFRAGATAGNTRHSPAMLAWISHGRSHWRRRAAGAFPVDFPAEDAGIRRSLRESGLGSQIQGQTRTETRAALARAPDLRISKRPTFRFPG